MTDSSHSAPPSELPPSQTIGLDARKIHDFGIGTYIQNLVRALATIDRHNHYVLFVGPQGVETLADLPDNFELCVERARVYSLQELLSLSWKLWRKRVDLFHATHYVLPFFLPCRAVVTIHDIIHLLYPQFLPSRLALVYAQRMIRRSLLKGRRIIADSQNTKTDLMDYFAVDGRKIRVIYPGVADSFRQEVPEATRRKWLDKLEIRRPYVLFVGNPKPHKNLDTTIRAFAKAIQLCGSSASLVCVGARDGADFKIRQRAEQLGIADRVQLVGHVEAAALPAIYQSATLFLYPTLYEGFGLPVVEAMASGVPVITSNTSALKEVAEGYADLVSPLEVHQIAESIAKLLTDEDHRLVLAGAGRKRADEFRWRLTAEKTLDVYASALRGRSEPYEMRSGDTT